MLEYEYMWIEYVWQVKAKTLYVIDALLKTNRKQTVSELLYEHEEIFQTLRTHEKETVQTRADKVCDSSFYHYVIDIYLCIVYVNKKK